MADDPRRQAARNVVAKALYTRTGHTRAVDVDTTTDAVLAAIDATAQNVRVVQLEVNDDDGHLTHGYTSLHRTMEGAETRLRDTASAWGVDLDDDPQVVSMISLLPIED